MQVDRLGESKGIMDEIQEGALEHAQTITTEKKTAQKELHVTCFATLSDSTSRQQANNNLSGRAEDENSTRFRG